MNDNLRKDNKGMLADETGIVSNEELKELLSQVKDPNSEKDSDQTKKKGLFGKLRSKSK